MFHKYIYHLVATLLLFTSTLSPAIAEDKSAVVLLYHRFGEDTLPTTNIRLDQFETQIAHLTSGNYNVLPLSAIVQSLKNKEPLPERTVAITVDDAYKSVFDEAWPRLKAAGLPMTLFVSTDPIDENNPNYMSWDDIRALRDEGVEIAHHTASHLHMIHAGLDAALADMRRASGRFQTELGFVPDMFAYPYGEYSPALRDAIEELGFVAGFAQYSGPAAHWSDPYVLPRFPVNERFGNIDRFRLITNALALPVEDITPASPVLSDAANPPVFGFTVDGSVTGLGAMACYPSHLGAPAELITIGQTRMEVRFDPPFPRGRSRINCTLPAGNGRWYWLGQFFYLAGGRLD
ncbi:polysaccharide deacetylase family protein [Kordiimonas aquimaris]|uniref:polysaccharide deacetylase family protein n=1 Tax=Kordiimonas aquimaris TaxID=707591 RepID=UPI0021D20F02|nr:polysaccharide deacetylase family protein [Kordiimonas aquimaris]